MSFSYYIKFDRIMYAGFSLTRKCASETHCLAEKLKRDAKRQGERVLSDAHGLDLKRSAKNCFENKIRIWNNQGCAATAAPCSQRPAFIFE